MLINAANQERLRKGRKYKGTALDNTERFVAKSDDSPCAEDMHISIGAIPAFRERPPWLGADLQTLRNFVCGGPPDLTCGQRLLLPMPDGDRLAARLDPPVLLAARPIVVLVHGVAGSESSADVVATMRHLVATGWPVLRLNLRGSFPSRPTSSGRYHGGRSEDLAHSLRRLPPFSRGRELYWWAIRWAAPSCSNLWVKTMMICRSWLPSQCPRRLISARLARA